MPSTLEENNQIELAGKSFCGGRREGKDGKITITTSKQERDQQPMPNSEVESGMHKNAEIFLNFEEMQSNNNSYSIITAVDKTAADNETQGNLYGSSHRVIRENGGNNSNVFEVETKKEDSWKSSENDFRESKKGTKNKVVDAADETNATGLEATKLAPESFKSDKNTPFSTSDEKIIDKNLVVEGDHQREVSALPKIDEIQQDAQLMGEDPTRIEQNQNLSDNYKEESIRIDEIEENNNLDENHSLSTFALYQAMAQQQEKTNVIQQQDDPHTTPIIEPFCSTNSISSPERDESYLKKNGYPVPPASYYSNYPASHPYYNYQYYMSGISPSKAYPSYHSFDHQARFTAPYKRPKVNQKHTDWWAQYYAKYYQIMATTSLPGQIPPPPPNPWTLPNLGLSGSNTHFNIHKGSDNATAPFKKRRVYKKNAAVTGGGELPSACIPTHEGANQSYHNILQPDRFSSIEHPPTSTQEDSQRLPHPILHAIERGNSSHHFTEDFSDSNSKNAAP